MTKNLISTSWFSISRRKMLGGLLVGIGALLTGCGLTFLGQCASDKGKFLLNHIPNLPPGLNRTYAKSVAEAVLLHSEQVVSG